MARSKPCEHSPPQVHGICPQATPPLLSCLPGPWDVRVGALWTIWSLG